MTAWAHTADQTLSGWLKRGNWWLRRITLYVSVAGFWLAGMGAVHLPVDLVAMLAFGATWIAIRTDMRVSP